MEHYQLQEQEVVLYKGEAKSKEHRCQAEVLFTNLAVVLILKKRKLFAKAEISVETYPTDGIKFYKDKPQVIRKAEQVEIYTTSGETTLLFAGRVEAKRFENAALEYLTDKGALQRGLEKVKGTIDCVDNTMGINTVGVVKDVATKKTGLSLLGDVKNFFKRKK
jgi:hypothetical protein